MSKDEKRYNDFNAYLRKTFGERVQKITVDAGFTCPNRDGSLSTGGCIYCNPRGSGTGAHARQISITDQLLQGRERLARRYKAKKFLAYFQSFTNTYAPLAQLQAAYGEALAVPGIVGLSIGTRPDCVDDAVLDLLEGYAENHLVWIEYGIQTIHDSTLRRINRGHDFRSFEEAVRRTHGRNIKICAHVILGLPGETADQMRQTASVLAGMGIDGVKLHLLYVIRGTRLDALYQAGQYRCLEQEAYVGLVCDVLERVPREMVIQRLTGDPHPHELVAPRWSLQKNETLRMIQAELEKRNTRQGRLYPAGE